LFSIAILICTSKSNAQVNNGEEFSGDLYINGDLTIGSASTLENPFSDCGIYLNGDFHCYGNYHFDEGTFYFDGFDQEIVSTSGDYFNNMIVSTTQFTNLLDDITINGNLLIESGGLCAMNSDIYIKGNWTNNVDATLGFQEASATVTFNGTSDQYCYGEQYSELVIDKSSGEFIIPFGADVNCEGYNWTSGILTVDGGTFTTDDILDQNIVGTYQLIDGQIDLHQDATFFPDVNGSIIIYDGVFNIHGGGDDCYFAAANDTYLYMEGGTLDVKDWGIHFDDGHLFSHVVSGGTIKMNGGFSSDRHDFNPTGGTIELYGTNNGVLDFGWGNEFYDLKINKIVSRNNSHNEIASAKARFENKSRRRSDTTNTRSGYVDLSNDLIVSRNMEITSGQLNLAGFNLQIGGSLAIFGTLKMVNTTDLLEITNDIVWKNGSTESITDGEIKVGRDWYFKEGAFVTLGAGNTVRFTGNEISEIFIEESDNAEFNNVIVDKSGNFLRKDTSNSSDMVINGDLTLNENNEFQAAYCEVSGELFMDSGSLLTILSGDLNVESDVECNGHLNIDDENFTADNDFLLSSSGEMTIDGGSCNLYKPYTGNYLTFSGTVNLLNQGFLKIYDENVQFTTTPNIVDGNIQINRSIKATTSGAFSPTSGRVFFSGSEWSNIDVSNGNYFHDMTINKYEPLRGCILNDSLKVNNDLGVESGKLMGYGNPVTVGNNLGIGSAGVLDPDDALVKVGGNWNNYRGSVGFAEGSSTVQLFGNAVGSILSDETFYNLELNRDTGSYYYSEIAENANVNIENNLTLNNGKLMIFNNAILDVDKNIYMQDGTTIRITDDAVGVQIKLGRHWFDYNNDNSTYTSFIPGTSTVTCDGDSSQVLYTNRYSYDFNNLIIDNDGSGFYVTANISINGDLNITNGAWTNNTTGLLHRFYGDVSICTNGWNDNMEGVAFIADHQTTFERLGSGVDFYDVYIGDIPRIDQNEINKKLSHKDNAKTRVGTNVILNSGITVGRNLSISNGILDLNGNECRVSSYSDIGYNGQLIVDENAILRIGDYGSINVNNGGILEVIGTNGNEATITELTGYPHYINVYSGGTISAEFGIFEYLASDGVYVRDGGIVNTDHAFNNCTFQIGDYNGQMLRIDNDQNLVSYYVNFPTNTWGNLYNVVKYNNEGSLDFTGAMGGFAGETYENDMFGRINWSLAPAINVHPNSLAYGDVIVGESSTSGFYIENTGGATLSGTITMPDGYTVTDLGRENPRNVISYSIAPSDETPFRVVFSPTLVQSYDGQVIITHNAFGSDEIVNLTGNGIPTPPPEISVSPDTLNFGNVTFGTADTLWMSIENFGGQELTGEISPPEGYSVFETVWIRDGNRVREKRSQLIGRNGRLSFSVPAGDMKDFDAVFEPTAMQNYDGNIVITHNAGGGDYSVPVIGTGVGAVIATDPISFDIDLALESSSSDLLNISNTGNIDLDYIATIEFLTRTRGTLVESGFEDFVPPMGWSSEIISGTGDWMQEFWAHSGMCSAWASPWDVDDARLITPSFTATADCILKYWIQSYDTIMSGGNFAIEVSTDGINWTMIDDIEQNSLPESFEQKSLPLASYNGQSIQVSFRAYNNLGALGVLIDDVEITGDDNPLYSWLSLDGVAIATGTIPTSSGDDVINVGFDSVGLSAGSYSANINISSNDPINPELTIPVNLTIGSYGISVNPNSLGYEEVEVGTSSTLQFTIDNTGSLLISGSINTPAGFSVSETITRNLREIAEGNLKKIDFSNRVNSKNSISYSLAEGEMQSYDLTFEPTVVQTYSGNVTVSNNQGLSDELISITGEGISGEIEAPANLSIEISGTDVVLNWDAVSGAISYKIYSFSDPNEAEVNWNFEKEVSITTWNEVIPIENKFYYVIAVK